MGIVKRSPIGIILAALSFLIYVCTVFSLPQQSDNTFNVERTSLAAAVSNIVYGARVGTIYSGALEGFLATIDRPLRQVLDEWPSDRQRGNLVGVSNDGNGVGYVLAATMAIRIFGLHAMSLPLLTVALMGLSALLLLWRFHGDLAGLVVLYFCSLTVLLFTMLVWDPVYAEQIAVGGIRYFSLVAILPAFHLLFDLLDPPAGAADPTSRNNFLLGVQATILLFALLVRTSAGSLIGAIVLVWLLMAWRSRGNTSRLRMVLRKGAAMALVGIGFVAAVVLSAPGYAKSGRLSSVLFPPLAIALLVAALGNMFVYSIGAAGVPASDRGRIMVAGTLLFTTSTIPPYLVAWATPETIADLLLFCVFGVGLALGALCLGIRAALRQQVFVKESIRAEAAPRLPSLVTSLTTADPSCPQIPPMRREEKRNEVGVGGIRHRSESSHNCK